MVTRFSKWMIYVSSYCLLYPLLIIRLLGFTALEDKTLVETWAIHFEKYKLVGLTLIALFVISITWSRSMLQWNNNTRIKYKLQKNVTFEMAIFLSTFIVPMLTIDIDGFGIILNVTLFIIFGLAFVFADIIHLSPAFLLMGYKLYSNGKVHILSKRSLEEINLFLDENIDGVPARELCKNTYILL